MLQKIPTKNVLCVEDYTYSLLRGLRAVEENYMSMSKQTIVQR